MDIEIYSVNAIVSNIDLGQTKKSFKRLGLVVRNCYKQSLINENHQGKPYNAWPSNSTFQFEVGKKRKKAVKSKIYTLLGIRILLLLIKPFNLGLVYSLKMNCLGTIFLKMVACMGKHGLDGQFPPWNLEPPTKNWF